MSGRVAVVTGARRASGSASPAGSAADGYARGACSTATARASPPQPRSSARPKRRRWPSRPTWRTGAPRSRLRSHACASELGPVEIVVTSAGIESFDPMLEITPEKWDRIIAVNLTGTFTCVQLALPDMVAGGWGRIVTISSSSAQSGAPNMAHYVASKGGVIGADQGFRRRPGAQRDHREHHPADLVDTPMARAGRGRRRRSRGRPIGPMVPVGRAGTPDDIAAACSFLCSDGGSYITGQVIGVNGGMYI